MFLKCCEPGISGVYNALEKRKKKKEKRKKKVLVCISSNSFKTGIISPGRATYRIKIGVPSLPPEMINCLLGMVWSCLPIIHTKRAETVNKNGFIANFCISGRIRS